MKKILRWLIYLTTGIAVFIFSIVGPIDRSPLSESSFYKVMMTRLDSLSVGNAQPENIKSAWGRVNITPSQPQTLAGYTFRDKFDSVHDSLYCRIIAIQNPKQTIFLLSADLLLFPPELKERIEQVWHQQSPDDFFYYSATHTHNGVGGWDKSMVGRLALGSFSNAWLEEISGRIVSQLRVIKDKVRPSHLSYVEADASEYAENRVVYEDPKDGLLRGIQLVRDDSTKAMLVTYSAHATCISKKSKSVSGDYPSVLVRQLENNGYAFAMFMSGMVGSHRLAEFQMQEFELTEEAGRVLSQKIQSATPLQATDSLSINAFQVPIEFGPSQLRIAENWKVRDWIFSLLLDDLRGNLTVLQIGNILLIGTPCDFSGEIFVQDKLKDVARQANMNLIITSFNGNYVGYITADHHYDTSHKEEVMALNWVGPYYGAYFSEMIQKIVRKAK